ncbi:MAG: sugar transferase [Planctomycetes bacterium]|nr:sugar transferase [Planctomycetota bacterium]
MRTPTTMPLASLVLRARFDLLKDFLDRFLAGLGLLMLLPVLALLALAIKLGSRGPVFFVQERVGRGGKNFGIIKLRTMVMNAEADTGPIWARVNDPRITRLGRFLRATHLDEAPQLINILRGEMSLVGPRPERPFFVDQFKVQVQDYEKRLDVKPGITGLAQVSGHYDETVRDVERKLRYDLLYIKRMCLMTDVAIIFLTVRCLTGRGTR